MFQGVASLLVALNVQPGTRGLTGIASLALFVSACATTTTPPATSIETALDSQSDYIVEAQVRSRPIRLKVDPGAPFFVLLNDKVAKELRLAHPDLAHELAVVNRLTNAGMPREEALRGLWKRTGVLDIRALVSSLIQSEKWGTSIATVLRVAAETLRRKRRQDAERRAKMAPLKMTFPLLFFILPALFTVILGPAVVQIIQEFSKV